MLSACIGFDWEKDRPPEPLSFGLFFRPILPRLRPFHWICDCWPLHYPWSEEASLAFEFVENGIAPPDWILPKFADEFVGDRDAFFGVVYAFMTNDGMWCVATREEQAIADLRAYTEGVRGMSFRVTPSFGM